MFESGRGGRREGAGRKPKKGPTKLRTFRLKTSVADWLESESKRSNLSQGDLVDLAVETLQENPEKLIDSP